MARRENFHRTPLYVGFQQLANVDKPKKYKDFENDLLSWSYVILEKHAAHALTSASIPCNSTADGFKAVADQIPFRYMGTYWESKPSNRDPDDFQRSD
jgi:hypothetical protein